MLYGRRSMQNIVFIFLLGVGLVVGLKGGLQ